MSELDWTVTEAYGFYELVTDEYVSPVHSMKVGAHIAGYCIFVFNGKTNIINGDITCYIKEFEPTPDALLLLRMQSPNELNNCYAAWLHRDMSRIYRIENGFWVLLASGNKQDTTPEFSRFKFRVKENHLELFQEINGAWIKLLEVDDDTFSSGAVGFGCTSGYHGAYDLFDNVEVSEEA